MLKYHVNVRDCKCCKHTDIRTVDLAFLKKEITQAEAARRLECSPAYYSIHINRDVMRKVRDEISPIIGEIVKDTAEQLQEIKLIFDLLVKRGKLLLSQGIEQPIEGRIRAIISEIRQYGEFLARLEGKLSNSPTIQINQLSVKYQNLIGTVMEDLCPVCKSRLVQKLEGLTVNV